MSDLDDSYGYGSMSIDAQRIAIANLNKEIILLKEQKKEYVQDTNKTIKELDTRLKNAVDHLKAAEIKAQNTKLEDAAAKMLSET